METIPVDTALERLARQYPHAVVGLNFDSPWQLLIAAILAARANDRVINEITPVLFDRFPSPADLAKAPLHELEHIIVRSGTYRQKAARCQAAAKTVVKEYSGTVPRTMEELLDIPGVARKTANVVLSNAFGTPAGIVVDTHVSRVGYRTGLSFQHDPVKMERELMGKIPRDQWGVFENRIKILGQTICTGRKAYHDRCFLADICPKYEYRKKA